MREREMQLLKKLVIEWGHGQGKGWELPMGNRRVKEATTRNRELIGGAGWHTGGIRSEEPCAMGW